MKVEKIGAWGCRKVCLSLLSSHLFFPLSSRVSLSSQLSALSAPAVMQQLTHTQRTFSLVLENLHCQAHCNTVLYPIVVIYDRLTSRGQLCSASHQPVQNSSTFVESFSIHHFSLAFARTVQQCRPRLAHINHASFFRNFHYSMNNFRESLLGDVHPYEDVKCCCSARSFLSHSSKTLQHWSIV